MTSIEELFGARVAEVVPDAIGRTLAAEVRSRLERTGYSRYALLDRGSYDIAQNPDEPELFAALTGIAARVTGRSLAIVESRALRLHAGDYLLAHHDQIHGIGSGELTPVELILDLSAASVPGAEVHYRRRGQVYFRFPCVPGSLAVVERGPTVTCNHTYVSKLHTGASAGSARTTVERLVVLLR